MRLSQILILLMCLCVAAGAHAVTRTVFISKANVQDYPAESISFSGTGITTEEVETERKDGGVLITLNYSSSDGRNDGTLTLPPSAGPNTRFELPNSTRPLEVDPLTGLVGSTRPTRLRGVPDSGPRFQLGIYGGATRVSLPETGTNFGRIIDGVERIEVLSDSDVNRTQYGAKARSGVINVLPGRGRLEVEIDHAESDDDDFGRVEPNTEVTYVVATRDLPSGALLGPAGGETRYDQETEQMRYAFAYQWPTELLNGAGGQFDFRVGLEYLQAEVDFTASSTALAFPGFNHTLDQSVEADTIRGLFGGVYQHPWGDGFYGTVGIGLVVETIDIDFESLEVFDIFGTLDTRVIDDSSDDTNAGGYVNLGVRKDFGTASVLAEYRYLYGVGNVGIKNLRTGDDIFERNDTADAEVDDDGTHGFFVTFMLNLASN